MKKKRPDTEQAVEALFAPDREQSAADPSRVSRIMLRVHQEIGMQHLTLLVFVRLWAGLLQMGALFYVGASRRHLADQTGTNKRSRLLITRRGRQPQ